MKNKKKTASAKTAFPVRFDSLAQKNMLVYAAKMRRQSLNQFLLIAAEELAKNTPGWGDSAKAS